MYRGIKKHNLLLIFILLVAFFIRTVQLAQTPNGFHADEASFYINAVALSQTGMDEDANTLPLSLASLIDPKPALYSYFQIPFLYIFNNAVFASRFASVLLAVVSLWLVYKLISELVNSKIAYITAILLTISPWHIVVSRGTQEVIASFVFLLISLLFLIRFLKHQTKYYPIFLPLFFVSSFLSMYFYHSAKITLPLLVGSLLLYHYKKTKQFFQNAVIIIVVIFMAGIGSLFIQESSSRISAVSIFSDKGPQQQLFEQIYTSRSEVPVTLVRVFYNKGRAYTFAIIREYSQYFSPEFLFFTGAKPTRNSVADHGLLYFIELPLLLIGIYSAIRNKRKELVLFLAILFFSPIPASLTTQETPSLLRSFPMIIALIYFISLGITQLLQINNKIIKIICFTALIGAYAWHIPYFALQYHVQTRFAKPWFRNSPYTKIAQEVATISHLYQKVEITNDLRPLYAYFVMEDLISITELQANPYARNNHTYTIGKFTFNRDVCHFSETKPDVLYIAEIGCREKNEAIGQLEVVKTISYDDGTKAYELLRVIK